MKWLLVLLLVASCSHQTPVKDVSVSLPTPVVTAPTTKEWKTAQYKINLEAGQILPDGYSEALELIKVWSNSDEFMNYVLSKHTYFSHTDKTVVEAVKLWRDQLNQADTLDIYFYTPWFKGRAIGGWDGEVINQNTKFYLTGIERAGHLLHETSHKYGWIHEGNNAYANDNQNSFPYCIGNDFEAFLTTKTTQLADK